MANINLSVVGVGNCFSALYQGLHYYTSSDADTTGLLHPQINGYSPADIKGKLG